MELTKSPATTISPEVTGQSTFTTPRPIRSRIRYIISSASQRSKNSTTNATSTTTEANRASIASSVTTTASSTTVASKLLTTSTSKPPTTGWNIEEAHRVRSTSSSKSKNTQENTATPSKTFNSNLGYNPFDSNSGYGYGQHREQHINSIASTYAPYVYGSSNKYNNMKEDETSTKKTPALSSIVNREAINSWAKDFLAYLYAPFLIPAAITNAITNAPDGVEHETLFGKTMKSFKMIFAKPQVRKDFEYESQESSVTPEIMSTSVSPAPIVVTPSLASSSSSSSSSTVINSTSSAGLMSRLKNTSAKWYNKLLTLPKFTLATLKRNNLNSTINDETTDSTSHSKQSTHDSNLYDDTDTLNK